MTRTLCTDCIHAVPSADGKYGCDWSRNYKPIEGWTAEPHECEWKGGKAVSYEVFSCPKYKRGETKTELPFPDMVEDLVRNLVQQSALEIQQLYKELKKLPNWKKYAKMSVEYYEIYNFLKSGGYGMFSPYMGDYILSQFVYKEAVPEPDKGERGIVVRAIINRQIEQAEFDMRMVERKGLCSVCTKEKCAKCRNNCNFSWRGNESISETSREAE